MGIVLRVQTPILPKFRHFGGKTGRLSSNNKESMDIGKFAGASDLCTLELFALSYELRDPLLYMGQKRSIV